MLQESFEEDFNGLPPEIVQEIVQRLAERGNVADLARLAAASRTTAAATRGAPIPRSLAPLFPAARGRERLGRVVTYAARTRPLLVPGQGPLTIASLGEAARRCVLRAYALWAIGGSGVGSRSLPLWQTPTIDTGPGGPWSDALETWARSNARALDALRTPSIFVPAASGKSRELDSEPVARRYARSAASLGTSDADGDVNAIEDLFLNGPVDVIGVIDADTLADLADVDVDSLTEWAQRSRGDWENASPPPSVADRLASPAALDAVTDWLDIEVLPYMTFECLQASAVDADLFPRLSDIVGLYDAYIAPYAPALGRGTPATFVLIAAVGDRRAQRSGRLRGPRSYNPVRPVVVSPLPDLVADRGAFSIALPETYGGGGGFILP